MANFILANKFCDPIEGNFYDLSHYTQVITEHTDCFLPNGNLLFSYRKQIIPQDYNEIAYKYLHPRAIHGRSNQRGSAAGKDKVYVKSQIIGYYDKPKPRLTAFNRDYPDNWNGFLPYFMLINQLYRYLNSKDQQFTTCTLNYNFRTACHKDKGNYGLSILTTLGKYTGCYLGFPEYGLCIDIQEGDLLVMNPFEYHCNTEFQEEENDRVSIVTYTRKGYV